MRFYPAYTRRAVLDEYAVSFFSLLNEAYRLQHNHYRMLVQIALTPHMKEMFRKEFMTKLEWASKSPDDILKPDEDDDDNIDDVKNLLKRV